MIASSSRQLLGQNLGRRDKKDTKIRASLEAGRFSFNGQTARKAIREASPYSGIA
jgi:hypothetical protein